MKLNKILLILVVSITISFSEDVNYNLHYFGNITLNTLDKDGYAFRNLQSDQIEDEVDYEPYSKLGAQLNINKDNLDFTAQVVAGRYQNSLDTDLRWLNAKYTYDDFAIRVGKMQLPLFLNSNTLDVDYLHTWAKAPIEVYGIFPAKTYTGLEFIYQHSFDGIYLDFQATPFGKIKEDVNILDTLGEVTANLDDIRNVMLSVEIDNLILKSSYTQGNLTIPLEGTGLNTLTSTLLSLGFSDLANKYSFQNTKLEFLSLGLDYSYKNFLFNSEISRIKSQSFLPDMIAYYALVGYRYNKWTPFMIYARNKNDKSHFSEDGLTTDSLDPIVVGTVNSVRTGLEQELYKMNSSQKTLSLGVKYDYKPGVAFKFQVDRITTTDYGTPHIDGEYERFGFLSRERGIEEKPVHLFTLSVAFAF